MPAIQSLVLTDRATTPVAHTFTPRNVTSDGIGMVAEATGVAVADPRFSIGLRDANGGKKKVRILFTVPIVQTETINGISRPKIIREGIVDCTFTVSADSTEQERKNLVGMFASAFDVSKVLVNDTVVNLNYVY